MGLSPLASSAPRSAARKLAVGEAQSARPCSESPLDGRVCIVTGAGRGLGRAHALHLASRGAAVVVNDLGGDVHGEGADLTPAQEVVAQIEAAGGRAAVSGHDVSDWTQSGEMVRLAVETFGALHVLVNNAGILRDRTIANMSEDEWEAVLRVHLKGHAAPTHHAMGYWRAQAKGGDPVRASVVHTSSVAGFTGNFGQANYSAAKAGVIGLSAVVALEGEKIGVRSNAVSPSAKTRISELWSGNDAPARAPNPDEFDAGDPGNVSPLIGWLATESCPATNQIFQVDGGNVMVISAPRVAALLRKPGRWTIEELDEALPPKLQTPPAIDDFFPGLQ